MRAADPHDDDHLLAAFRNVDVPEPRGLQRRLVGDFAALYEAQGLLSGGQVPPLYDCCPNASVCWRNRDAWKPVGWGGVSLPWIGPDYPESDGVVVITINMDNYGGLLAEFALANSEHDDFGRAKKRMFYGNSRRQYGGSDRAYRTTCSAASALDKLDGDKITDHVDARELVSPLQRIARWNVIKCSPHNQRYSKPFDEMWSQCPEMLLADEIRIAKPKVVLAFGVEVFAAVGQIAGFEHVPNSNWPLKRGALVMDGRRIGVLGLYHPTARSRRPGQRAPWRESHDALLTLLRSADDVGS